MKKKKLKALRREAKSNWDSIKAEYSENLRDRAFGSKLLAPYKNCLRRIRKDYENTPPTPPREPLVYKMESTPFNYKKLVIMTQEEYNKKLYYEKRKK